jgi:hypothetical protein
MGMSYLSPRIIAWAGILVLVILWSVPAAFSVETGPVDRKWGLGWDNGLTARLWLGGVWELGLAAGPNDFLNDSEEHYFNTGGPPSWDESENQEIYEEKQESGFVRLQAGRLVSRRGPLALVCFSGLQYQWSDYRFSYNKIDVGDPEGSYTRILNDDDSTWSLSLGLRPSFVILDFLTIETAFGLEYRWIKGERIDRTEYPETGQVTVDIDIDDGNRFLYSGWNGMGSLQFIIWF